MLSTGIDVFNHMVGLLTSQEQLRKDRAGESYADTLAGLLLMKIDLESEMQQIRERVQR